MPLTKYKGWLPDQGWNAENANSVDPDNVTPQSAGHIDGAVPSALSVFKTLGSGANNGKFKINIDGVVYDNVAIALDENPQASGTRISFPTDNNTTDVYGMSFTVTTGFYMTSFSVNVNPYGNPALNWQLRRGEDVAGTVLATGSAGTNALGSAQSVGTIWLDPGVYCVTWVGVTVKPYVRWGSGSAGNRHLSTGSTWGSDQIALTVTGYIATPLTYPLIASKLQTAIRAVTSKLETVTFPVDRFIITSSTVGKLSKVLKLLTPTAGTDISGNNATPYLNCGVNATETPGDGEDYNLMRFDSNGLAINNIVKLTSIAALANRDALCLKPYQSDGGIVYNNSSNGSMSQMNATYNASFTVNAGNNRMLVVSVYQANTNGYGGTVAVTFDGVAMTQVAVTPSGNTKMWTFILPAPSTGAKTLAITTAGFGNTLSWTYTAHTYNNVVQSTTPDATATVTSGTTLSITTVNNGCLVVGAVAGSISTGLPNNRQATTHSAGDSGQLFPPQSYTFTWGGGPANAVSLAPITIPVMRTGKANATVAATATNFIGFSIGPVGSGSVGTVCIGGILDGFSGLTSGGVYYLSNTDGLISLSPGSVSRKVGIAVSTCQLLITNVW